MAYDDLESEYNARHDDHAERWASEREDAGRAALADLADDDAEAARERGRR